MECGGYLLQSPCTTCCLTGPCAFSIKNKNVFHGWRLAAPSSPPPSHVTTHFFIFYPEPSVPSGACCPGVHGPSVAYPSWIHNVLRSYIPSAHHVFLLPAGHVFFLQACWTCCYNSCWTLQAWTRLCFAWVVTFIDVWADACCNVDWMGCIKLCCQRVAAFFHMGC